MKLLVFPANKDVNAFARYGDMVKEFNNIAFVVPRKMDAGFVDFASLDGGPATQKCITDDFDRELRTSDAVLFLENAKSMSAKFILNKFQAALSSGKRVYAEYIPHGVDSKAITVLSGSSVPADFSTDHGRDNVYEIPVPVVFILGSGPNTHKFLVQVALRKFFIDSGYAISQVGTKCFSNFFGFPSIPSWTYQSGMTEREKIIALNRFFYNQYVQDKPEVMLIGVPGGFMPMNPMKYEDMGIFAYLISQAVTPDAAVFCSYAMDFTDEYVKWQKNVCKYKLNAPIRHVIISNTSMNISLETRKCEYITKAFSSIDNLMVPPNKDIEFFYSLDKESLNQLGKSLLNLLISNL